jgi:hypothetical protein
MKIFTLLIFASCSIAAATASGIDAALRAKRLVKVVPREQQQVKQQHPVANPALLLRGGGLSQVLPEPLTAAKWYSRIGLVQGVLMISAPSTVNKWYEVTSTRERDWLMDCIGHAMISSFVFTHCLLDRNNLDVNQAMAYSLIVWFVFALRQVLNDKVGASSVGYKKDGFIAGMLLHALTIYTVFGNGGRDNSLASVLVKAEAVSYNAFVPTTILVYGYN